MERLGSVEHPFKIILCGKRGVGKTTLFRLLSRSADEGDNYPDPISSIRVRNSPACNRLTMTSNCEGKKVKVEVWDTDSMEAYSGSIGLTKTYYRNSHAAILIYESGNEESKAELQNWARVVRENCPDCILSLWCNNRACQFGDGLDTRDVVTGLIVTYNIDQRLCFSYTESDVQGVHTHFNSLVCQVYNGRDAFSATKIVTDSVRVSDGEKPSSKWTGGRLRETCPTACTTSS